MATAISLDAIFPNSTPDPEMELSLPSQETIMSSNHPSKRARSPENDSLTQRVQKVNKIWPALSNPVPSENQNFPVINLETSSELILIKPFTSNVNPNTNKFFKDDKNLAKILDDSILGKLGIDFVRKNLDKDILIVYLKNQIEGKDLEEVLGLDKLGSWNVETRLPQNRTISFGVMPLELDISVEEMETYLRESNEHILKLQRLYKGRGKEKTLAKCVKVTFNLPECPSHLKVGYSRVPVSLFIDSPWQCFKCQRFGHSAADCHSKARCMLCGREHLLKDCPGKNNSDFQVKCINCNGPHAANYGGCKRFREAKKVERVKAEQNLSYSDAIKVIKQQTQNSPPTQASNQFQRSPQNFPRVNSSQNSQNFPRVSSPQNSLSQFRTNPTNEPKEKDTNISVPTREIGCQTKSDVECQTETQDSNLSSKEMLKCFAKIVTELIKLRDNENIELQCNKLINEAFNVNISEPEIIGQTKLDNPSELHNMPITPESLPSLQKTPKKSEDKQVKESLIDNNDISKPEITIVANPTNAKISFHTPITPESLPPQSKGSKKYDSQQNKFSLLEEDTLSVNEPFRRRKQKLKKK